MRRMITHKKMAESPGEKTHQFEVKVVEIPFEKKMGFQWFSIHPNWLAGFLNHQQYDDDGAMLQSNNPFCKWLVLEWVQRVPKHL